MTVHFVYIKGDEICTPNAITNEVALRLKDKYPLKVYDWSEKTVIHPAPGDILIGHPNRDNPKTVYNLSFWQPGWARRILFNPFHHAMVEYNGYVEEFFSGADIYLAICGRYWFDTIDKSLTSHWRYKLIHCDLAVNRKNFYPIKERFNSPGHRRFLYIGNTVGYKGTDYLAKLADANPNIHIGWIGKGKISSRHLIRHGYKNFKDIESKNLVASYDFLLTCGRSDPNPTTILESAAWGLIPIATVQCGYYQDDWLINIPLDDVPSGSRTLARLNSCPEEELLARQKAGFRQLDEHYNWDRVVRQICEVIEMPIPSEPTERDWQLRKEQNQAAIRSIIRKYRYRQSALAILSMPQRGIRLIRNKVGRFLRARGLR